jgi:hypothetical protein
MNQVECFKILCDYSKANGFALFIPGTEFDVPKGMSGKSKALIIGAAALAAVALGGRLIYYGSGKSADKDRMIGDLQRMPYCDFVGVKLSSGTVQLRLGINSDNLSGEALVGRFAMIHERAIDFRKYASMNPSALTEVFTTFSSHKRAREFIQNFADKCKHLAYKKMTRTFPVVIDLEDEDITSFAPKLFWSQKPSFFWAREIEKLKETLFQRHKD